jgi:hypothetical protein
MNELPEEVEALALKALESEAGKRLKVSKAVIGQRYDDGDRKTFRSPIGDQPKLGMVYRTDPEPVWTVTDLDALDAHLAQDPDNLETTFEINADASELLPLLLEHAPHLVDEVERVTQAARGAAMAAAKAGKAIPGIAKVKSGGVLTVTPDKNAAEAITGLVQAGLLTWDGRRALPESTEGATR